MAWSPGAGGGGGRRGGSWPRPRRRRRPGSPLGRRGDTCAPSREALSAVAQTAGSFELEAVTTTPTTPTTATTPTRAIIPVLIVRSEEHTSELQSRPPLLFRLLLAKKKNQSASRRVVASLPPDLNASL